MILCVLAVFSLSDQVGAEQQAFHNAMSMQGYTGILNTPSAHVTEEGWLYALYTNQEESKWRRRTPFQDNYMFSVGLFNFIELGGRFFEAPRMGRDLSGNIKVTSAPLTRNYPMIPVLAAGIQDIGGGAVLLQTKYVVLSEDIWRFRFSGGYGKGPQRMKGLFAGGEFKAHDWLYLLGEYDTKETNVGARVVLPQFWKVPLSFTATAKTSLNYRPGSFEVAVGFSLPLDFMVKDKGQGARGKGQAEPEVQKMEDKGQGAGNSGQGTAVMGQRTGDKGQGARGKGQADPENIKSPAAATRPTELQSPGSAPQSPAPGPLTLPSLRDSLIREGFLNVRVGTRDSMLLVEYENTIFNHNELDALGLVSGLACEGAPEGLDTLRVVIKRRNIRMAAITMPLQYLRNFMKSPEGLRDLRDHMVVDFEAREKEGVNFVSGDDNSGMLNTTLMLAPGLTTFIGTEYGVFDYLLSLKPELVTTLWKGAAVNARWDLPISWSDNLENGRQYRNSRQPAQLERVMLFQTMKPLPFVMVNLGAGMILHDRYGMLNEATWSPGGGDHRFRVVQGWNKNSTTKLQTNLLLGSYRYYFSPLDLSLEGAAGKFWAEDKGFSLEMKRFWGDTSVSLYYKDTKGNDHKRWRAAGIQFSFPLTPRRDMKPLAKIQVRGSDEWSYAQETTLKNNNSNNPRGNLNYLAPYPLAINPQPTTALYRSFYNRDRLSESYISKNLERLRESWLKYRP